LAIAIQTFAGIGNLRGLKIQNTTKFHHKKLKISNLVT